MRYSIICPWKFAKSSDVKKITSEYIARISQSTPVELINSGKIFTSSAESNDFIDAQLAKIDAAGRQIIALDEGGDLLSSQDLANLLAKFEGSGTKNICFCVGGAYGLSKNLAKFKNIKLVSLSKMTLPHEIAVLLLSEQIYRAKMILVNHPYHHGEKSDLIKHLLLGKP